LSISILLPSLNVLHPLLYFHQVPGVSSGMHYTSQAPWLKYWSLGVAVAGHKMQVRRGLSVKLKICTFHNIWYITVTRRRKNYTIYMWVKSSGV